MTRIVCHRGASLYAPENTFAAAALALELGGSVIELDIRETRDGVLYILHDETVDRTTNGTGVLAEMTSADIDALDAGRFFGREFVGEPVPRLDLFLEAFKDQAGFYLEVKEADCGKVGDLVRRLDIGAQCYTCSFDPDMRAAMREEAPEVGQMIHWNIAESPEDALETYGAFMVEFFEDDFEATTVRACQTAGLKTQIYTDQIAPRMFAQALDLGVTYANIDHIKEFATLRDAHRASAER